MRRDARGCHWRATPVFGKLPSRQGRRDGPERKPRSHPGCVGRVHRLDHPACPNPRQPDGIPRLSLMTGLFPECRGSGRTVVGPAREEGPVFNGKLSLKEEPRPAMMIYVGNLDYTVTSDVLRALFEPYGAVTMAEVQVRSRTGQSRGFALVEMPNQAEARAAIEGLNGQNHQDRPLTVNESRPRRTVRDLYTSGGWYGGGPG